MVRYVQNFADGTLVLKKSFLRFSHAEYITGRGLSEQIIQLLTQWELQLENPRAQGYDGVAFMADKMNGVQAIISRPEVPKLFSGRPQKQL